MTTATANTTRDYYQAKIERARAKGRKTSHHRRRYADWYEGHVHNPKLAAKAASFASLAALLLWALTRDHRRNPLGKRYTTLRDWAALAGYSPQATIAELKRLHRDGRVEYTGGDHSWDCGLWHCLHTGPKRDLGRVACRLTEIDERGNYEASCEVDGYAVTGYGKGAKAAKQALGRRLAACGLTGTLSK